MNSQYEIQPMYRMFYYESMLFNTSSAKLSCEIAHEIIKDIRDEKIGLQNEKDDVLNNFQNFINQSAAISKYFWLARGNNDPRNIARSQELKKIFEMEEDSPLKLRKMRNAIEHYDERLDSYLSDGIVGYIIPSAIMFEEDKSGVPQHYFKAYSIKSDKFYILGEELEISPLIDEMKRVHNKLLVLTGIDVVN